MTNARAINRRAWLRRAAAAGAVLTQPSIWKGVSMAGEGRDFPIVDSHVHVWTHDPRYPWSPDVKEPPSDDALPETLLRLMADNGVDKTVIVHVIYYQWDCRYAAAAVSQRRDKFAGVCRIDPHSPTAIADLGGWVAANLRGLRLSPAAGPAGNWITDRKRMDPILDRCVQLKIPFCPLCPISRIPDIERIVERYRDRLDVCVDHMADCPIDQPEELKKLLALAKYPRVYVKLSHVWSLSRQSYPYRDTHDQVRRLYDAFGPQRLMWGTDWPGVEKYCTYAQTLALYRDEIKFFNDDDKKWILGGTALKLWQFSSSA